MKRIDIILAAFVIPLTPGTHFILSYRAYLKVYCGYGNNKVKLSMFVNSSVANDKASCQIIDFFCLKVNDSISAYNTRFFISLISCTENFVL